MQDGSADFELLDYIHVEDGGKLRRISLYCGDLSKIPKSEFADFLIMSAFPNDYIPVPGTLIASLNDRGISVSQLALKKEHDLRSSCGFWLSQDLRPLYPQANVGRILCFEPLVLGPPPSVVGELFRGLFPFLDMNKGSVVATSLLSAGKQRWPADKIFELLVDAAVEWLSRGLPVDDFKIVVLSKDLATKLRPLLKQRRHPLRKPVPTATKFDLFISYSTKDLNAVHRLTPELKSQGASVFDFRLEINPGLSYQTEIDRAIEECSKIVAIISPAFLTSPECQEELAIARLRNKREGGGILFPIYWESLDSQLALWLQALNFHDAREKNQTKLVEAAQRMLAMNG